MSWFAVVSLSGREGIAIDPLTNSVETWLRNANGVVREVASV